MIKKDCFAFISIRECNSLTIIDCTKCPFFKKKAEIKNNVFYPWSYKSKKEYLKAKEVLQRNGKI